MSNGNAQKVPLNKLVHKYYLQEHIGEGQYGKVYKATHQDT